MILKRKYDLNVVPGGGPLMIRVSQNDSSSQIALTLYAGSGSQIGWTRRKRLISRAFGAFRRFPEALFLCAD